MSYKPPDMGAGNKLMSLKGKGKVGAKSNQRTSMHMCITQDTGHSAAKAWGAEAGWRG